MKRIYDAKARGDGFRVLIDRLWPRGVAKDLADIDLWAKDVAPSTALRREFAHMPERFEVFTEAYREELAANDAAVEAMLDEAARSRKQAVTLLYAARDESCNHAIVLREYLEERAGG